MRGLRISVSCYVCHPNGDGVAGGVGAGPGEVRRTSMRLCECYKQGVLSEALLDEQHPDKKGGGEMEVGGKTGVGAFTHWA